MKNSAVGCVNGFCLLTDLREHNEMRNYKNGYLF